jgi:hypothetical protein
LNKEEKKHYAKIAQLGCSLCRHLGYGETPAEIHHIRRFGGKRENAEVIGLCPQHHRFDDGIHGLGRKGFEARYGLDEQALLLQTKQLLESNLG